MNLKMFLSGSVLVLFLVFPIQNYKQLEGTMEDKVLRGAK